LAQLGAAGFVVVLAAGIGAGLGVGLLAAVAAVLIVLVLAGLMGVLLHRRYRAWRYAEREDDLLVGRGVMFRRLTVVPYGRMQFVDVTAGPVDRLFGLATVQLHTAAAATDAKIPGLTGDEAQRLRDQLASLGESRAAGL
jgi:hypothetical protein